MNGIILAGGKSSRMGRDKADLPWGTGTLLEHAVQLLQPLCDQVIVATNTPRLYLEKGIIQVPDRFSHCGPLGGMQAGLSYSQAEINIIIACDMPFLTAVLLQYLAEQMEKGIDAVVPYAQGRWQPLSACYRRNCLPLLEELVAAGEYRVRELLARVSVRSVDEEELRILAVDMLSFDNLNTPQEYVRKKEKVR